MTSLFSRLLGVFGMQDPPIQREEEGTFQLKEMEDGRLRFMTISTNNYQDRKQQTILAEAHKKAVEYAEKFDAYPELWPWHMAGQRLGVVDVMDFEGNFLISSGLIDEGMEAKAKAWASDPNTAMSHGFFRNIVNNDIVEYLQFEQSVLPRWAAANPFTDFTVGVKDMALTPQKRAEFAQKGYTEEELAALESYTDTFRQKLAEAGVQFKDLDDNQPQGQPAQPQGQPQQQPPAQNPAPQQTPPAPQQQPDQGQQQPAQQQPVTAGDDQPVTLAAIRQVVNEAVDAKLESRLVATTNELETLKGQVASFKGGADEYFANLWQDKGRAARASTPSHSNETVVSGGTPTVSQKERDEEKTAWVDNLGVLNHPFFNAGAARIAAGKNGQ